MAYCGYPEYRVAEIQALEQDEAPLRVWPAREADG
jgi:hypothetical protein